MAKVKSHKRKSKNKVSVVKTHTRKKLAKPKKTFGKMVYTGH
jgi:hypothetical protein